MEAITILRSELGRVRLIETNVPYDVTDSKSPQFGKSYNRYIALGKRFIVSTDEQFVKDFPSKVNKLFLMETKGKALVDKDGNPLLDAKGNPLVKDIVTFDGYENLDTDLENKKHDVRVEIELEGIRKGTFQVDKVDAQTLKNLG